MNEETIPQLWDRLSNHKHFMHRMAKTHRQVLEALLNNELDTAKFLSMAILTDWADFVMEDFDGGI